MARRAGALESALDASLLDLALRPADQAVVELARTYARVIDGNVDTLNMVGRAFRETLEQLGMTPKARAALATGGPPKPTQPSPLDELRARRAKRLGRQR